MINQILLSKQEKLEGGLVEVGFLDASFGLQVVGAYHWGERVYKQQFTVFQH